MRLQGRKRSLSQGFFHRSDDASKSGFVVVGDFSQDFAVEVDLRLVEASYELAVSHAMAASRGVDTGNLQAAEYALFVAAVTVGVLTRLHDSLLGYAKYITTAATETLGQC